MAVDGGGLKQVADAETVKFVHIGIHGADGVALVHGERNGLAGLPQHGGHVLIGGGDAGMHVHHHDNGVGQLNADFRLTAHEFEHFAVRTRLDAAGIHQGEGAPAPFAAAVNPVPGDAGGVLYDGGALPCEFIEKHGFAHIGSPDDGDQRFCHGNTSFPCDRLTYLL